MPMTAILWLLPLALSGHRFRPPACPFLRAKRTSLIRALTSAHDPKWTSRLSQQPADAALHGIRKDRRSYVSLLDTGQCTGSTDMRDTNANQVPRNIRNWLENSTMRRIFVGFAFLTMTTMVAYGQEPLKCLSLKQTQSRTWHVPRIVVLNECRKCRVAVYRWCDGSVRRVKIPRGRGPRAPGMWSYPGCVRGITGGRTTLIGEEPCRP